MNFYLLIPFFIILLCFLPIKLEGRFSFNLLNLSGAFGLFLYNIKLLHEEIWIKHKKIIMQKDKNIESKEISFDSREVIFLKIFIFQILAKIRLRLIQVIYNLGVSDAFKTAMIAGYINESIAILYARIKSSKPTASLEICDNISFNKTQCQFAFRIILSISLFDIAYSFIRSVILTKKDKNIKESV